jgi:hypothetical protein
MVFSSSLNLFIKKIKATPVTEPKKRRTFAEWLRDIMIGYILPIAVVCYVNYTKCWPYQMLKDFSKGSMAQRHGYVNDDMIYTGSLILFAGLFYGILFLYKKIFKKST